MIISHLTLYYKVLFFSFFLNEIKMSLRLKSSFCISIFLLIITVMPAVSQTVPSDSGYIQFVGNRSITFVDASRANRNISCLVYYPSTSEGSNTPVLQGSKFPSVSFGHGFTLNPNLYIALYRHLASWGYIVIAPSTETGFAPNHTNFALDLAFVLKDMKRRNGLATDNFFGVVDTTVTGVFGHSMGGGCSVLAGSFDSSITAVASLAAANTNPSSITAANLIKAPQLYMSGQRDSIASYWTQQLPHYNNSFPFKQTVNIKGGNHSYFHLVPGLDDLVDNPATITRQEQQRLTRRYVTSFFNIFLKNDSNYRDYLYGNKAMTDTTVITNFRNIAVRTLLQGFYNQSNHQMVRDTIMIIARSFQSPYSVRGISKAFVTADGYGEYSFGNLFPNSKYYFQIIHRNSIETWSTSAGFDMNVKRPFYDFSSSASNAYGNNMIQIDNRYLLFGGDVNQDGIVDAFDQSLTDNDAFGITTGYVSTDVNGDGIVDAADLSLIDNNSFNFVQRIVP